MHIYNTEHQRYTKGTSRLFSLTGVVMKGYFIMGIEKKGKERVVLK